MLDFGFCLKGPRQDGRKIRFVVDYKSLPFAPTISQTMVSRHGFFNSIPNKRFSIIVDPSKTYRCEFTTTLVTDDPIAEIFLNDVLEANKSALFTPNMIKPFFKYYVMDEKGSDIPLIPNIDDVKSSTGSEQIQTAMSSLAFPIAIGAVGYFYYKYFYKKKGRK